MLPSNGIDTEERESQFNEEILEIRDRIIKAVPVEKLYLFGSYAYGNPDANSDYDFYIVLSQSDMRPIDAIGDAYMSICDAKYKATDILAGTIEIFDRRCKQLTIERKIASEGVLLYERQG